jgi:molybdopterin-containing oxidoreductase family iron-sulfur binding subunit
MKPDSTDNAGDLVGDDGYAEAALNEFPEGASEFTDEVSRRRFLTLMGASLALAGATGAGCLRPAQQRKIVPYTTQPDEITPGVPLFFASAAPLAGFGQGVLVRSSEGRPTKIEGNPDHPASLGGAGLHALASVLDLYDPDRSAEITQNGATTNLDRALGALRGKLFEGTAPRASVKLRILTETVTSPTLAALIGQVLGQFPQAKWVQYDAVSTENARTGIAKAFGKSLTLTYDFLKADVVVSLDSDFLCHGPGHVRYSRDFADRRKIRADGKTRKELDEGRKPGQPFKEGVKFDPAADPKDSLVNRLYAVETMPTNTGAVADHRLALTNAQVLAFARTLAFRLGVGDATPAGEWDQGAQKWVEELAKDLQAKKGKSIIVAGDHLPVWVHTLVAAMNAHLGNIGQTVQPIAPVDAKADAGKTSDLSALTAELAAKRVDALLILGGANPAYSAPADIDFAGALREFVKDKTKFTFHLGSHMDETAVLCEWHVNEAHYLETWGDIRGRDGTASIQQPLIAPLYAGKSAIEILAVLRSPPEAGVPAAPRDPLEIVKATWHGWFTAQKKTGIFEVFWQQCVRKGVIDGTTFAPEKATTVPGAVKEASAQGPAPVAAGEYEINFRACPALFDGRYANNGWLQELPKPLTKISWDNAAFMSPATAQKLGASKVSFRWTAGEHGRAEVQVIEIDVGGKKIKAPVWALPGHADGAITVHLGHGRERAGRVGNAEGKYNVSVNDTQVRGFNAYPIRTSRALWVTAGKAARVGGTYILACTQGHWAMVEKDPTSNRVLDRKPVRYGDLNGFRINPLFAKITPVAAKETVLINENIPEPKADPAHPRNGNGEGGHDKRLMPLNMYQPSEGLVPGLREFQRRRWAMAIDLNACTGCSACVVACQGENNTPVVGKEQVTKGREMYWISIDRYYGGFQHEPDGSKLYFQPRMCVQCENAPCEVVCPVGATTHSADGLNDMAYNRCVGTRYCSNNCPYKVRRFNFLTFQDWDTESLKLGRNPDVSVRSRGVMEKCTFCVQRIRGAEIVAERELALGLRKEPDPAKGETLIKDGEILTACQAACPSAAIVFGDINDPHATVSHWKHEPQTYGLLADLNTRPRLTHMAIIRNPNPNIR